MRDLICRSWLLSVSKVEGSNPVAPTATEWVFQKTLIIFLYFCAFDSFCRMTYWLRTVLPHGAGQSRSSGLTTPNGTALEHVRVNWFCVLAATFPTTARSVRNTSISIAPHLTRVPHVVKQDIATNPADVRLLGADGVVY